MTTSTGHYEWVTEQRIFEDGQSTGLSGVYRVGGERVEVRISRDRFYPRQSHATASVWSDATKSWNRVASIPWSEMESCKQKGLPLAHSESGVFVGALKADRDTLLYEAAAVLL